MVGLVAAAFTLAALLPAASGSISEAVDAAAANSTATNSTVLVAQEDDAEKVVLARAAHRAHHAADAGDAGDNATMQHAASNSSSTSGGAAGGRAARVVDDTGEDDRVGTLGLPTRRLAPGRLLDGAGARPLTNWVWSTEAGARAGSSEEQTSYSDLPGEAVRAPSTPAS